VIRLARVRNREANRHFIEKWGIGQLDTQVTIVVSDMEKQLIATNLEWQRARRSRRDLPRN